MEVSAGRTCAQAARRLQGVLKAHRDVPPIEDERRLRHDLTLQLPQPGGPIRENRRRCAETDTGAHNRVGKFVRRIAIASKGEAMLGSIEILRTLPAITSKLRSGRRCRLCR